MRISRVLAVTVAVASLAARADVGPLLEKAEAAVRELEYPAALKALEAARKEQNLPRATLVRILELQALTLATAGQEAKALKAFNELLSLTPDYKLTGNFPPRVTTVFYEARSWVEQRKGLAARQAPAAIKDYAVTQLQVEVTNDPLKLVKEVRFHVVIDGKDADVDVPVSGRLASTPVKAPRLTWWAELLGERKAVLLALSSAASPLTERAPSAPVAVAPKPAPPPEPKPEPKPEPAPVVTKVEPAPKPEPEAPAVTEWAEPPTTKPMSTLRLAGLAVGGGGVACAALGVVFGAMANGTTATIANAERDADGRVIGLTQREAVALDAQQRTQATVANVLLVSGAVLAAGGVTLFILGRDGAQVAVVPAAGGLAVAGSF